MQKHCTTKEASPQFSFNFTKRLLKYVGVAMKNTDPSITLIGPVDSWDHIGSGTLTQQTARYFDNYIDILCWHVYGANRTSEQSDADRMAFTKEHYYDVPMSAYSAINLKGYTTGKTFPVSISEYNITQGEPGSFTKIQDVFNATWCASAVINALNANLAMFNVYCTVESTGNSLGFLDWYANMRPHKTYYPYYMFGNFTGDKKVASSISGGSSAIEYYTTKDSKNGKYYITVVNKDTDGHSGNITFNLSNISSRGYVNVRQITSTVNPDTISAVIPYSNGSFNYVIPPITVANFEIIPNKEISLNGCIKFEKTVGETITDITNTGIQSGNITCTVPLISNISKSATITVISAVYKTDGENMRLYKIYKCDDTILLPGEIKNFKVYNITVSNNGLYIIKTFIWNDTDNVQPITPIGLL